MYYQFDKLIVDKVSFKSDKKAKASRKMVAKSDDAEIRAIFGDREIYENSPPSPITVQETPAPSPNGSLTEIAGSPESPQSDPLNLLIDETDVIKKFTISKTETKVALEKEEVRKINLFKDAYKDRHVKIELKMLSIT